MRAVPLVMVGGSGGHRRCRETGVRGKILGTYCGHPIPTRRVRGAVSTVRLSVFGHRRGRVPDDRVNRVIVRGLGTLSPITCIEFTSICERFGSTGAFVSRLGGFLGWWGSIVLCS